MALVRVDNRLVHGQILEAWAPHVNARCIMVVNDNAASDFFCETVIRMAVPSDIEVFIYSVADFAAGHVYAQGKGLKTIVLFDSIADALRAYEAGFCFEKLNIGNIHHEDFQICCSQSVSLHEADVLGILNLIEKKSVIVELRRVPREKAFDMKDILKKLNSEKL